MARARETAPTVDRQRRRLRALPGHQRRGSRSACPRHRDVGHRDGAREGGRPRHPRSRRASARPRARPPLRSDRRGTAGGRSRRRSESRSRRASFAAGARSSRTTLPADGDRSGARGADRALREHRPGGRRPISTLTTTSRSIRRSSRSSPPPRFGGRSRCGRRARALAGACARPACGRRTSSSTASTREGATLEMLERILAELPEGTTELMCHPGRADAELRAGSTYADERERETGRALRSGAARAAWTQRKIRLIGFDRL